MQVLLLNDRINLVFGASQVGFIVNLAPYQILDNGARNGHLLRRRNQAIRFIAQVAGGKEVLFGRVEHFGEQRTGNLGDANQLARHFGSQACTVFGDHDHAAISGLDKTLVAAVRKPCQQDDVVGRILQAGGESAPFINEIRLQQQEILIDEVPGTIERIHAARIRKVRVVDQLHGLGVSDLQGLELFCEVSRHDHNSLDAHRQQSENRLFDN
ncbi:MAG: hypothetical protein VCA38_19445 [Roseibacillus sp.]